MAIENISFAIALSLSHILSLTLARQLSRGGNES